MAKVLYPNGEPNKPVDDPCAKCGRTDTVLINTFHWNERAHIAWRCVCCRHVWVTPERRSTPRDQHVA